MKKRNSLIKNNKGFTLIEILIVIGLIALLSAVVIIAVNPSRQFSQARNSERWSEINTILNAVYQYAVDNNGTVPSTITASSTEICASGATCPSLIDLDVLDLNEAYLVELPQDPECPDECATNGIGYAISKSTNGRVTVSSPDAELSETISVTR
jgi:type IV pilus assembly protein PilA